MDDTEDYDQELEKLEDKRMPNARSWEEERMLNELMGGDFDSDDDDESNKRHADGTRERNLILWESATWRQKFFAVFEPGSFASDISVTAERVSFTIAAIMVAVILLSCATVVVQSYPEYMMNPTPDWVGACEVVCVVIFSYDLILRFITCPDRKEFAMDPLNWIDLAAILPFYIEQLGTQGARAVTELRILRVLRLARIVRIFRLFNISKMPGMAAVLNTIATSYPGIFLFLSIGLVMLIMCATAMFYAERGVRGSDAVWRRCHKFVSSEDCDNGFGLEESPFQSIIDALWWTFNTLSTNGLGDVYPIRVEGELVACLTMLLSVFILALPAMILMGNFDASYNQHRILNTSWVKLSEQQRKLRRSDLESPRTQIIRKMGWNDDEPAEFDEMPKEPEVKEIADLSSTMSVREVAKARSKLRRKRRAERIGRPIGAVQFCGHTVEVYRRQGKQNKNKYFYEPLFRVAVCDDGGPVVTIIRGRCNMPTLARLQLELDHPELRKVVVELVRNVDPVGTVTCDLGGGFEILHFASSRATTDDGASAWDMRPQRIYPGFRASDCPIYFEWTQNDAVLKNLHDDDVAELVLSHLLGTALHIRALLPVPAKILRIPVEQQIVHHTRFQRELGVIATRPTDDDKEDQLAFISKASLQSMLEGVSRKIIIDPHLTFENPADIEAEVADRLISRLREMKVSAVPQACKSSIFDFDLLNLDDIVHEVPMSLFDADAQDEVEEDALGYIDAKMMTMQARCIRVDIKMEFDVPDY